MDHLFRAAGWLRERFKFRQDFVIAYFLTDSEILGHEDLLPGTDKFQGWPPDHKVVNDTFFEIIWHYRYRYVFRANLRATFCDVAKADAMGLFHGFDSILSV
jgi:hypothetical protein